VLINVGKYRTLIEGTVLVKICWTVITNTEVLVSD